MNTGWGHEELKGTGLLVIAPHVHVGGVLNAVYRHAVDEIAVHSGPIRRERNASMGRDHGHAYLTVLNPLSAGIGIVGGEVEGRLGGGILYGIDKLDTRSSDNGLAVVVRRGVRLWYINETGSLIHDEAVTHHGIRVVLSSRPISQLSTLDVGTGPTNIIVGIRVNLEEYGMGDRLRKHGRVIVGHAITICVRPQLIEGRIGELAAIDHGSGNGEHVLAGQLVPIAHILSVGVSEHIILNTCRVFLFGNCDRFKGARPSRPILVECSSNSGVTAHGKLGSTVHHIDSSPLLVVIEDGHAICVVSVVRGNVNGYLAAYVDGNGLLIGPIEREGAVVSVHQCNSRRLRLIRVCSGRKDR